MQGQRVQWSRLFNPDPSPLRPLIVAPVPSTSSPPDNFSSLDPSVVPKEQRLQAVQAAIALMPDENREVLQTLLYFLSDIASAEENQMTSGNLAVCLAPSLFHLNVSKKESTSPR